MHEIPTRKEDPYETIIELYFDAAAIFCLFNFNIFKNIIKITSKKIQLNNGTTLGE
jgi:hypothetical protein